MPWVVRKIIGLIFTTPEKGALTTIMLASDQELEAVTGKYYDQCEPDDPSPLADDEALRTKLWEVSADLTGFEA